MSGTTGQIPLQLVVPNQLITSALWNQEFQNISALLDAAGAGGHSDTDSDAQIQTNPFPGSVLSNAASIAGEIERIRYVLAHIIGKDFWYKPADIDLASVSAITVPLGGMIDFPVATPPNGNWHLCDGTAISRSVYSALFALMSVTYGPGNGTTTFNLPDYRDRMPIGAGNLYGPGVTGGEATHTLTTAEIPASNVTDPGHVHTITDPGHIHTLSRSYADLPGGSSSGGTNVPAAVGGTPLSALSNTTGISVNSGTTGLSVAGGGGAHNNLPPYIGGYKMIRVL